jgi:hypothetical protein
MVDALREAHRVLRPAGVVADIRPERDPGNRRRRYIQVECRWKGRRAPVGEMYEAATSFPEYAGADRAVAKVIRARLFWLERTEIFWLRTHFRDLSALDRFLAQEWTETTVPIRTRRAVVSQLRAHPGSRIVAADAIRLNVLRKSVG